MGCHPVAGNGLGSVPKAGETWRLVWGPKGGWDGSEQDMRTVCPPELPAAGPGLVGPHLEARVQHVLLCTPRPSPPGLPERGGLGPASQGCL